MGGKVPPEYADKRRFVEKSIVPSLIHGAKLSPKALESLESRRNLDKAPLLTDTILLAEDLIRPVRSVIWNLLYKNKKSNGRNKRAESDYHLQ
jgi:hypothetical protein